MPIMRLDGAAMLAIRDRAFAQRKRRFANHVLQVLGTILNWGRPRKLSAGNPNRHAQHQDRSAARSPARRQTLERRGDGGAADR
jgi:hypothetical protein